MVDMYSTKTDDQTKFSHNIYKNNPLLFKSYIGKEAKITADDGSLYTGIVYTVDPVSESVVLLETKEDNHQNLKLVFGHAIKNIELTTQAETSLPELFQLPNNQLSLSDIKKRKNIVKDYLLKSRFPVVDIDDILCIEDSVSIKPPYDAEHCVSTNVIILNRIQDIIRNIKE
ncbi:PREDICTED: gem-associated protein 6-like [Polistes dominula]|uniref:Gem-associated protein 6-like n=1 Tax=Polistes dominula TaxID=743375 RepID=A0ABM1IKC6_POLDO|nr:PREDICTED: gem-associated protein 6-like [Polistes dominula]